MPDLEFMSAGDAEAYTTAFETAVPAYALKSINLTTGTIADALRGGNETSAGVDVTLSSAMRVGAVLACVRVLAEDVAKLPLQLKEYRTEGGKKHTNDLDTHPAMRTMRRPNEYMTQQDFLETMTAIAALKGTAYALKLWVPLDGKDAGKEELAELWPLLPGQCHLRLDLWEQRRELWYDVWTSAEGAMLYPASELIRIKGPSLNGIEGLDMVRQAAETIGLNSQIVKAQARFYGKDQRPSGVLSSKLPLGTNKEGINQRERLQAQWDSKFGPGGSGGLAILDGDWQYSPITISAHDADTMKLWEAMIADACRVFRVSPVKVMQASGSVSYNSLEQTNQNHLTDSLEPWLIRWEQGLARDLLSNDEWQGRRGRRLAWFFDRNEYTRPLPKDRYEIYAKARQNNLLTVNDIRDLEDMPRIDDNRADDPFQPLGSNPGGNPSLTAKPKTPAPDVGPLTLDPTAAEPAS